MIDSELILRKRTLDLDKKKVLIANLSNSEQERDLTHPPNCNGYGRIRHFKIHRYNDWSPDPLPNYPAAKALGRKSENILRAQVFQIAVCNWNCWYCFVDAGLRNASVDNSRLFSAGELVDLMLKEEVKPDVIDLSGGQPDIVPEWTLWMMDALTHRGLEEDIFLWNDDNLSTYFLKRFLTKDEIQRMVDFPMYARVGCFKGYDPTSFSFNTSAASKRYDDQFEIFRSILDYGFDMYGYVTFTSPPVDNLTERVETFVDELQSVHMNLPLRTVPLKIEVFSPTRKRMNEERSKVLKFQYDVHREWCNVIETRFSKKERQTDICDVRLD